MYGCVSLSGSLLQSYRRRLEAIYQNCHNKKTIFLEIQLNRVTLDRRNTALANDSSFRLYTLANIRPNPHSIFVL